MVATVIMETGVIMATTVTTTGGEINQTMFGAKTKTI
jgi:hypothetical protein